jgi:dGTPase
MQDLIDETARRLASYGDKAGIRTRDGYTVEHSDSIRDEVSEVWTRIQVGKIHHDPRVIARNRRSARIVSRLLMLFSLRPGLVEREFRERHAPLRGTRYMSWYRDRVKDQGFSIPNHAADELALHVTIGYDADYKPSIDDVIQAKDYVASLTDQHAERVYLQLLGV